MSTDNEHQFCISSTVGYLATALISLFLFLDYLLYAFELIGSEKFINDFISIYLYFIVGAFGMAAGMYTFKKGYMAEGLTYFTISFYPVSWWIFRSGNSATTLLSLCGALLMFLVAYVAFKHGRMELTAMTAFFAIGTLLDEYATGLLILTTVVFLIPTVIAGYKFYKNFEHAEDVIASSNS